MARKSEFQKLYARLKKRRDELRASVRNPRPAKTPLAISFSTKKGRKRDKAIDVPDV